jgi:glycosyltransferase involved in cell wall biosynthesis
MVVAYYTSTYFMDVIIETIQSIKHKVELHVFIEISTNSKNATIIDVESLEGLHFLERPERVLGKEKWAEFKDYFEGVASVHFVVFQKKRSLSIKTMRLAFSLGKFLKRNKVDIIHFDTISTRAIGMYSFLKSRKLIIALHDPVPHSGENNWKEDIPRVVFYKHTKAFIFYSKFAINQFRQFFKEIKAPAYAIQLQPYSFIRKFMSHPAPAANSILFFGRLSHYKGIDILLDAIPKVLEKYPDEKFNIAGNPVYGLEINQEILAKYKDNITLDSRFLSTEELVGYLERAKFVVCPYRDATQSGVLMTAYAAGKMVLATNVGSFPEYVKDNVNGLLAEPNAVSVAEKIIEALDNDKYKILEQQVHPNSTPETRAEIGRRLLEAYYKAL